MEQPAENSDYPYPYQGYGYSEIDLPTYPPPINPQISALFGNPQPAPWTSPGYSRFLATPVGGPAYSITANSTPGYGHQEQSYYVPPPTYPPPGIGYPPPAYPMPPQGYPPGYPPQGPGMYDINNRVLWPPPLPPSGTTSAALQPPTPKEEPPRPPAD